MLPIDFLYKHATHILLDEMPVRESRAGDYCTVCLRDHSEWINPEIAIDFDSYGNKEVHCAACHTLYQGSFNHLGIERLTKSKADPDNAGQLLKGNPVPAKLGMLTGCGMLATHDGAILFTNTGFFNKLSPVAKGYVCDAEEAASIADFRSLISRPWTLMELYGAPLCKQVIASPPNDKFLFISNFGRKKVDLIRNLAMSDSATLNICAEEGNTVINLPSIQALREVLNSLPDKTTSKWGTAMKKLLRGQLAPSDKTILSLWAENPALRQVTSTMPVDPYQRLEIIRLLEV